MPVPTYAKIYKKKISLQITYLQNDKVYTSDYHFNIETDSIDQMEEATKKRYESLRLMVNDIYKQLNDKFSQYIFIEDQMFIINKKDFLNCNVVNQDISK